MSITPVLHATLVSIAEGNVTHRELMSDQGITINAVTERLQRLSRMGLVTWHPGRRRTLQLTLPARLHPPSGFQFLPVVRCRDGQNRILW